jgi:hypothetical protein
MLERDGKLSKGFPSVGIVHDTRENHLQFPARGIGRTDQ